MPELRITRLRVRTVGPVDLTVLSGECVGINGPSGAGKSIFLRAVADMIPHHGTVSLDGAAAASMPAPQWRRRVGLLPSESAWWCDTVGPHFDAVATDALVHLGFEPDVVGWAIDRLSSGERQRLALVRLLAMAPEALLLDEPTANLDATNSARVESLIGAYRNRHASAVIWISHDAAQLDRMAERRYRMDGGALLPSTA